jgi:hypothetical protein
VNAASTQIDSLLGQVSGPCGRITADAETSIAGNPSSLIVVIKRSEELAQKIAGKPRGHNLGALPYRPL